MDITLKRIPKLILAQFYMRNPMTHRLIARTNQPRLDRPVFILGVPRSGTSVFCNRFGAHRDLAHWSEAPTVWDPRHRDPKADHRWTEKESTPSTIRRINNNFAFYTRLKGKSRFVNKHPRNSLRVPFLVEGWPDCFLIHVERDPRAVTNSLIHEVERERWRQRLPLGSFARPPGWREFDRAATPVERFSRMVVATYETLLDDLDSLDLRDRVFTVRYEEFATDCRSTLRAAFEHCELPIDEGAIEAAPERLENRNYKWLEKRTRDEVEIMRDILTPLLIRMRYETDSNWLERLRAEREENPTSVTAT
ncbi:MAG: sulfotransferase family protein [Phycisphaerales bacterium]